MKAECPKTGELATWAGLRVLAESEKEAQLLLDSVGAGYCRVIGALEDAKQFNLN